MTSLAPTTNGRATKTVHSVVVVDEGTIVLDETFDTPSARRAAVADLMIQNHDELASQDVVEIMAPFGGADADTALELVIDAYASVGVDVTVHLGTRTQDIGPAELFTVLTDYGDGAIVTTHYPTRELRMTELRSRAAEIAHDHYPADFFSDADEETCRKAIEYHVAGRKGRVYLVDAARQAVDDIFTGHIAA